MPEYEFRVYTKGEDGKEAPNMENLFDADSDRAAESRADRRLEPFRQLYKGSRQRLKRRAKEEKIVFDKSV